MRACCFLQFMLQFHFLCHIQGVVRLLCTFILLSSFSTYLPFDHYCFHLNVNSLVVYVHHFAYFFSLGQLLWSLSVDVKGRSLGSVVTKSRWPGITTHSPLILDDLTNSLIHSFSSGPAACGAVWPVRAPLHHCASARLPALFCSTHT